MTIVVCSAEAIKIDGNCLTFPMVKPAAPGRKSDASHLWTPIRHTKLKALVNLRLINQKHNIAVLAGAKHPTGQTVV